MGPSRAEGLEMGKIKEDGKMRVVSKNGPLEHVTS